MSSKDRAPIELKIVLLALTVVCAVAGMTLAFPPGPPRDYDKNVYGLWTTGLGHAVSVRRDGAYRFCDGSACDEGRTWSDHNGIYLLDFAELPAAQRLIGAANMSWDDEIPPRAMEELRGSLLLYDEGPDLDHGPYDECKVTACKRIGGIELYEFYYLMKIDSY